MKTRIAVAACLAALALALALGAVRTQPAGAYPNKQKDCTSCHGAGTGIFAAAVTAVPSASSVMSGSAYSVPITVSENPNGTFNTGYWFALSDALGGTGASSGVYGGNTGTTQSYSVSMTAPGTPGTYYYKVFMVDGPADSSGIVGSKVYSINVVAPVHDVATTYAGLSPRLRVIEVGSTTGVVAIYKNRGTQSETFTATVTATPQGGQVRTLDTRSLTLAAGETRTIEYPGVLTFGNAGAWTIAASASTVTGETVTDDNVYTHDYFVRGSAAAVASLRW